MTLNERLIASEELAGALRRAGRPNQDAQAHLKSARRALQIQDNLDAARRELDAAVEKFGRVMNSTATPEERERANSAVNKTRKQCAAVQAQLDKNGSGIYNLQLAERLLKMNVAA